MYSPKSILFCALLGAGLFVSACTRPAQPLPPTATPPPVPTAPPGMAYLPVGESSLDQYCAQNPTHCIFEGNPEAKVVVYELYDYGCPACQYFSVKTDAQILETYVDSNEVRYGYLPVALWETTQQAAVGAYCVAEQGFFRDWHQQMYLTMTEGHKVELQRMLSVVRSVGADEQKFNDCLASERYDALPRANIEASGIDSTPSLFFNGMKVVGVIPFEIFADQVEAAKAATGE